MLVNYKILVKGKVQGVWFRKYTKHKAHELALKGFVKNKNDGNVSIMVEGDEEKVLVFIDWLFVGSPLSDVTSVEFSPGELVHFTSFEIQR